jgi:hypothetical protein
MVQSSGKFINDRSRSIKNDWYEENINLTTAGNFLQPIPLHQDDYQLLYKLFFQQPHDTPAGLLLLKPTPKQGTIYVLYKYKLVFMFKLE